MINIIVNNKVVLATLASSDYAEIVQTIERLTNLHSSEFYLQQNAQRLEPTKGQYDKRIDENGDVHCILRVRGGKGGFGSMLRAIGAQIEKTTNREACRDLSGRRLRDINEEKRLKAWLEKQTERENQIEERRKEKIRKLMAVPKHDFNDKEYEETRSKVTETVNEAFEAGLKKELEEKKKAETEEATSSSRAASSSSSTTTKRKIPADEQPKDAGSKRKKVTKGALWIGDDISDTDSDDSSSDEDEVKPKAIGN